MSLTKQQQLTTMTNQHPITVPSDLVEQWRNEPKYTDGRKKMPMVTLLKERLQEIADRSAQWGSNQELEACCEWMVEMDLAGSGDIEQLRSERRPKPPSLKEQALAALDHILSHSSSELGVNTIRQALEQLPND